MRILHINCNYLGTALHQNMIEELDALGYDNEVFVPIYKGAVSVIDPNNKVFVSECFNRIDRACFDYKQKKIIDAIELQYDVSKFDLIHAYTLFTDGNCARVLSEKYGIPYVVAVRNTDVNDFFSKRMLLRNRGVKNLEKSTKIFYLSRCYQEQVERKYVPNYKLKHITNKSTIMPNGIDDFWFENKAFPKSIYDKTKPRLIFVGAIDKNKNIVVIQKAMDILCKEGIRCSLTVVGGVKDEALYNTLKIHKQTCFLGKKTKEEILELFKDNDIFVMASISETFGLVYAEAMSQGLPVLYTRGQGFDGQFEEGKVGFNVSSDSPEELAQKIKTVVSQYTELSANAVECCEKFIWKNIVESYSDVYTSLLNDKKKDRM